MTNWLNVENLKFEGLLIVLNIGKDIVEKLDKEFIDEIDLAIKEAHAHGKLVVYVFDSKVESMELCDSFDYLEGHDIIRQINTYCDENNFAIDKIPDLADGIWADFHFVGGDAKVIGVYSFNGKDFVVRLSSVPLKG